jgi:hypothetical protein
MFPLGTVAFPGALLPLHVFEPRYRTLTTDCLAGDASFGIVLIARGSEVGGGEERTTVGTRVVITKAASLADGRWLLMARGEERIRVARWLEDEPYPVAAVEPWPDADGAVDPSLLEQAVNAVRRTRALLSETRDAPALPAETVFDADPVTAGWQLCAEAPVTAYDRQQLLGTDSAGARLELLLELVTAVEHDLHRMLAQS